MLKDWDKLPPDVQQSLDKEKKERELLNYIPHPLFRNSFMLFWKLRNTKSFDHPINYLDIKALTDLYNFSLNIWEIETILSFQVKWYEASEKYKG